MKRFMMTAVAALVFSAVAGYNYYQHSQIDPRILENLEALSYDPPVPDCDSRCMGEFCRGLVTSEGLVYQAYCN